MFRLRPFPRSGSVLVATLLALGTRGSAACPTLPVLTTGTKTCINTSGKKLGEYTWNLWASTNGCITPHGQDATFLATWASSQLTASMGFQWDETKTFDKYGVVYADFSETKTGDAGQYSGIGISGWSNSPLVQYYILDDWFSPPSQGGTSMGTYTLDDGTYQVYKVARTNEPTIHGTQSFAQYYSVRSSRRECGRISISEHWKKWAEMGMALGVMNDAVFRVEVGGGTGSIDFKQAVLVANASTSVRPASPEVSSSGIALGDGREGMLSLVGLDGRVLRSARQTPSNPAHLSAADLPRGLYLLRFQADGQAPLGRKILLQ